MKKGGPWSRVANAKQKPGYRHHGQRGLKEEGSFLVRGSLTWKCDGESFRNNGLEKMGAPCAIRILLPLLRLKQLLLAKFEKRSSSTLFVPTNVENFVVSFCFMFLTFLTNNYLKAIAICKVDIKKFPKILLVL